MKHRRSCVAVYYTELQCVVVCCSVMQFYIPLQLAEVPRSNASLSPVSVLQCVAMCCSVLQCVAMCCSVLQCIAVCCSVLQCVAVCCSVLQCIAVHPWLSGGVRARMHSMVQRD